jgi:putative ABC transport system substrate-binding protein
MSAKLKRREFITLLGGAAAGWPLAARAQQTAIPVVGYIPASDRPERLALFKSGLAESGFVEGRNVIVEPRWAEGRYDRFPELVADLVRKRVAVIAVPGSQSAAIAAKAATETIPIVFAVAEDPVKLGLVASLSQPGGNATGINFFTEEVVAKRLALLREFVPGARRVAAFLNPSDRGQTETTERQLKVAAQELSLEIKLLHASNREEIDAAFMALVRERPDALFVGPDGYYNSRRVQFAILAALRAIPASFAARDYVEVGGLMSYGTNVGDAYRRTGVYAGLILKGRRPADLPVLQSTSFELAINLNTARALGLHVPDKLLVLATEVID